MNATPNSPTDQDSPTTRMVTVRSGQRLRVSEQGIRSEVPFLLVNGLGASLDLFEPLRIELASRNTISFDVPGVGGSPRPPFPVPMSWYADIVGQLLDELDLDQVDLLGLSWGGALAQEVARTHQARIRRLILAATMPGVGTVPGRPDALAVLATPLRYYSPTYLEAISPTLYGGAIRTNPGLLKRHTHLRTTHPPNPAGYVAQMLAVSTWSSLPWAHTLTQQTLVLAGDDDPIIPLVNGRILARRIPNARLEIVKDGGHLFLAARAAEVAPVIESFLQE